MKRGTPKKLIAAISFLFCFTPAIFAQHASSQLIRQAGPVQVDAKKSLPFFENKDHIKRFREVNMSDMLHALPLLKSDTPLTINLFDDVSFEARVSASSEYIQGTSTVTARIPGYEYAYMVISTTGDQSLATICIPEKRAYYKIIYQPEKQTHYLLDLDWSASEPPEESPIMIPPEPDEEEKQEMERIRKELAEKSTDLDEPVTIDVMVVYTPAANTWATDHGGGIFNIIANAMAKGQLALTGSATVITLRLVHAQQIAYTESSSIETDLDRFTSSSDGYLDAVHGWRNTFGADLCVLFNYLVDGPGGIAWLLNDSDGRPSHGFSVTRIQFADGLTPVHEMGHNMGCGHHKEQNDHPGPGLYRYSAGHRWTGGDGGHYCSVMTYGGAKYFADSIAHTRVPHFSFAIVNHEGMPTGIHGDAENARGIRNVKHAIAAYRSKASIDCPTCPAFDMSITPISTWRTHASSLAAGECKTYRITVTNGATYVFKTGCGDGASADFDTNLRIFNADCTQVDFNEDGCESNRSYISWVARYDGYAYLRVRGTGAGAAGSYTLAYQRPMGCDNTQAVSFNDTPKIDYWSFRKHMYTGQKGAFDVVDGNQYHWTLCPAYGGESPYDSQLTLRKVSDNTILAYSDDDCGNDASISWIADFSGTVNLILTKFHCDDDAAPSRLAYKRGAMVDPSVSVTPASMEVMETGGNLSFSVTANTEWTASSNVGWITNLGPLNSYGSRDLRAECLPNTSNVQRTGIITFSAPGITDVQVPITQMPGDGHCNSLTQAGSGLLVPANFWQHQSPVMAGAYVLFSVTKSTEYHWSTCAVYGGNAPYESKLTLRRADNNALIPSSNNNCGEDATISWTASFTGVVKLILTKNLCEPLLLSGTLAYRSGNLVPISMAVNPSNKEVLSSAGSTTFNLSANTSWEISSKPAWVNSITPNSGSLGALFSVDYQANPLSTQRTGEIQVSAPGITFSFYLTQYPNDGYCNSRIRKAGLLNPTENWTYQTGINAGDYVLFSVTDGTQYHWSLCDIHGAYCPFDSELTLRRADNNAQLAYGDQECGDNARISWTATFTGMVKVIVTKYYCESEATPTRLAYKSGPLENPMAQIVPDQRTVGPAEGTIAIDVISNTTWSLNKDVDWLKFVQVQGTGNATILLTYPDNTGSDRDGKILGTSAYGPEFSFKLYQYDHCDSKTQNGTGNFTNTWQYTECVNAGEYVVFPVTTGNKYNWSLCQEYGAEAPYQAQMTLRNLADNAFIAFSEKACENGAGAAISWQASFTGHVKVVITKDQCKDNPGICTRLAYKMDGNDKPYITMSPETRDVSPESGSTIFSLLSNTAWKAGSESGWISSLNPSSGTGNASISVDYNSNPGVERLGEIFAKGTATGLAYASLHQESDMPDMPFITNAEDITIVDGQSDCFEAFQYISLAPWDTYFLVEPGGMVNLVASESIHFYPGTLIMAGGYLHAWITTDGTFCPGAADDKNDALLDQDLAAFSNNLSDDSVSIIKPNRFFQLYPNPANNVFTLSFSDTNNPAAVIIMIHDIAGNTLLHSQLATQDHYDVDIRHIPSGLYFVTVVRGQQAGVEKLIHVSGW